MGRRVSAVEGAREDTGWELKVAERVPTTEEELRVLRDLQARTEAARKGVKA